MLPVIGLVALLLYLVLWKSGLLEELSAAAANRRSRRKAKSSSTAGNDRSRLIVFEEFIERLGEDDDPGGPQSPRE